MNFKESVYHKCQEVLAEKINTIQRNLAELRLSAANETKSTAGDKHETALAMLQIEQENNARQLQALLQQRLQLAHININLHAEKATNGSLISTNHGLIFVAIGLGKIQVDGQRVMVVSAESPLGRGILGSRVNDSVQVSNTIYQLNEII